LDYLIFKKFISGYVLIAIYYIGAIIIPIFAWFLAIYVAKKFNLFNSAFYKTKKIFFKALPFKYKALLIFCTIFCFFILQILWRMAIEFLLAYIQIRNALIN
jgi:hypothetical protein